MPTKTTTGEAPLVLSPWAAGVDLCPAMSAPESDGLDAEEAGVEGLFPYWLGSGSSSSTSSVSSLPALRNDSGEVVWRLSEKAMEYLRGLRGLPFRTIDEVLTGPDLSIEPGVEDETEEASCV